MENTDDNTYEPTGSSKYWVIGFLVILGLGALWYFSLGYINDDTNLLPEEGAQEEEISDIEVEINDIDLGDLDEDFESIDEDLENL